MADEAAAVPAGQTPLDLAIEKYGEKFVSSLRAKFQRVSAELDSGKREVMAHFLGRREASPAAPGCITLVEGREDDIVQLLCKLVLYAPQEWCKIVADRDLPKGVANDFKAIGVAFDASSRIRRAGILDYHIGLSCRDEWGAPRCLYACSESGEPQVLEIAALPKKPAGHVRIVAISDTHMLQANVDLPSGDVLLHGGDLSFEESRSMDAEKFQEWRKAGNPLRGPEFKRWFSYCRAHRALQWLREQEAFAEKLVVAGNHDYILGEIGCEAAEELLQSYGLTYLHDGREPVLAKGLKVWGSAVSFQVGLSAERAAVSGNIAFQVAEGEVGVKKVADLHAQLAGKSVDVLVTHTPPAGCLLGKDGEAARALRTFIEEDVRPKLFVCGHSHHPGDKLKDTWARLGEGTLGVNASLAGVWNQLHGYPIVVDIQVQ